MKHGGGVVNEGGLLVVVGGGGSIREILLWCFIWSFKAVLVRVDNCV